MLELKKVLLKEIMITRVHTAGPEDPLSKVWDLITMYGIRHVPLVNENNILQGIVTLRDLYKTVPMRKTDEGAAFYNRDDLDRYILKYIMTEEVFTLSPDDPMSKAIDVMVNKKYGCVPLVENNNKLVGIVTHIDILRKVAPFFL